MTSVVNPLNVGDDLGSNALDNDSQSSRGRRVVAAITVWKYMYGFIDKQFFLIFVLVAIALAAAAPSVGKQLEPSITTGYIATILIFIISGVTMNTSEFVVAVKNIRLNAFVLFYNMGAITVIMWAVAKLLTELPFSKELLDGVIILGTLPTSVSMCVILTTAASGDAAGALYNATALNIIGIFLTPAWLLGLMSAHTSISIAAVILSLTVKVIVPLIVGQVIRYLPEPRIQQILKTKKPTLKRIQDICLCCIVYATFCETFSEGTDATWSDLFVIFFLVLLLLVSLMCLCWLILSLSFLNLTKAQRVAGLFSSTHKTVALGIPLISAIFEDSENIGLYSVPLLIYHPLQLIIGSSLVPRLKVFVENEINADIEDSCAAL